MEGGYRIFPNPAKDFFRLKSLEPVEKEMKLTFFSTDGIPVQEFNVTNMLEENQCLVDVRNLAPGFYFLMICNGDKGFIQKLVIL